MALFNIDTEICNQDGICAAVCPSMVIDFRKGEFPVAATEAEELWCLGAMMVGHPRFSYQRLPTRKTPTVTWRW
jgi:ferredoxin